MTQSEPVMRIRDVAKRRNGRLGVVQIDLSLPRGAFVTCTDLPRVTRRWAMRGWPAHWHRARARTGLDMGRADTFLPARGPG